MIIAPTTRISTLIKENPASIEAIASISSHFEKLRNPLLRKVLASRVTIADAARIGGCRVEQFYEKLLPLGFTVPAGAAPESQPVAKPARPVNMPAQPLVELDVREAIALGNDPFRKIMKAIEDLDPQHTLLIINTFEPTPLLSILKKKGYDHFVQQKEEKLVYTYFWLKGELTEEPAVGTGKASEFDFIRSRFAGNLRKIDVRHLEMPQPMVAILNELEQLPATEALYVTHRRVPQFLLPQLAERGFQIAIKEISPAETDLLIYR